MDGYLAWVEWTDRATPGSTGAFPRENEHLPLLVETGPLRVHVPHDVPRARVGPIHVLGYGRIDDAEELARRLEGALEARGLDLVAHAFLRWGADLGPHLAGDYAFVLFDARDGSVVALRDPSGTKPLVFRRVGTSLLFARDPATLAQATNPKAPLEEREVRAFLLGGSTSVERTMFDGVRRLPSGHALRATSGALTTWRFWRPPSEPVHTTFEEARAEVARRLRLAVAARVDVASPVLVHASGGIDSSSLAAVATHLEPARDVRLVHVHCEGSDERAWARDLARHLGRHVEEIEAPPSEAIDDRLDPSHPFRYPLAAISHGVERFARREGARTLLMGLGGDEVFFERGVFRDLAKSLRFRELLAETWRDDVYSSRSGRFFLREALLDFVPSSLRAARARLRTTRPRPWLRGLDVETHDAPAPDAHFSSHTQATTWEWLTSAAIAAGVETEERGLRAAGIALRCPFLDKRLMEWVLALPFQHRVPHGRMKALLRDALGDALPPSIRERRTVMDYDAPIARALSAKMPALRRVLYEGPWRADPFVDRREAQRLFEAVVAGRDTSSSTTVWDIVSLELWLRA